MSFSVEVVWLDTLSADPASPQDGMLWFNDTEKQLKLRCNAHTCIVEDVKNKFDATAAPTVNDDASLDYEVGSKWIDTAADKAYVCVDPTNGAAIWKEITWADADGGATYATTVTSWTASGILYYADVVHNLGTEDIIVQGHLTGDKKTIGFEDIERIDANTVRVWVASQENVRVLVSASAGGAVLAKRFYYADHLDSPVNADWAVNALAPAAADPTNIALVVRRFDDTTEEGVGWIFEVPAAATNMELSFKGRAITAPGAARTVGLKLYSRGIPNNAAISAWSAGTALNDIDITTNAFFQYDTDNRTLASLGLTAGQTYQFELTRVAPGAGTNLTGDWALLELGVKFT